MRGAVALLLLAACLPSSSSFPVYLNTNGTVSVESALGGDVVFAPSGGGEPSAQAVPGRSAAP